MALPPVQEGPQVWYGPDLPPAAWTEELSAEEIAEIDAACASHADADLVALGRADFDWPVLGARLERIGRDLLHGRGFVLLRGLPVERMSRRAAALAFWGVGAHLGSARSQNGHGHALGHVQDLGLSSADPNVRVYQTRERQTFHTDSCDVVGLLCLQPAVEGGDSLLVSSSTMFNELRRDRPDLLRLLLEPLATDRRGEVPPGMAPFYAMPVFSWHAGHLSALYQRQYIDSAQRFPDAPRLTPAHVEALDRFDALADDPRLHLRMRLAPGDIQLVHNHTLLHDRTAFRDDPVRKRHLLRLWLCCPGARPLPDAFAQVYGSVTVGDRGGVRVPGLKRLVAPLGPFPS